VRPHPDEAVHHFEDEASAPPRPEAKRPSSAGLTVLAVCGFLALSVGYMESFQLKGVMSRVVGDLAFLVPITLSVVLSGFAYRRSKGIERRFWLLGAAVNSVLLISELYYVWWIVAEGGPPPGIYLPFQLLHAAAAVFAYALLATMTRLADAPLPQQLRWSLDIAAATVVTYVFALLIVVDRLFAGLTGITAPERFIAASYTAWGVLMICGLLWTILGPGATRWRAWERMIAFSLLIYAGGIVSWPAWYAAFQNTTPSATAEVSVLDLVLVLGHYLFAIGAADRLIRYDQAWPLRRIGPARRLPGRATTYFALALSLFAMPIFIGLAILEPAGSLERIVYATASTILALLTIARTVVAAVENGRLFHRSVTDPLTGLHNHRYFHERLGVELETAHRYGEPLSIITLDVDDFDMVNRRFGHPAGDEVLRGVGAALKRACRGSDTVCRVGGDEFAIVVRDADAAGALQTALRIQTELRAVAAPDALPPTVSMGVACLPVHADDAETLVRLAEGTVYWAKQHGKDQVLVYDPQTVSDLSAEDRIRTIEERTQLGTVRALASAVDSRHEETRSRSSMVAALAADLARRLGLAEDRVRLIETASLLHGVGMVALGDEILAKPQPPPPEEVEQVRRHPVLGEQIVGATMPDIALPWIRHHHERWDGNGYPDRLRAVAIPLESRIIAVCDAWIAMTSPRSYRVAMPASEAAAEMRACAGTQFDPAVVEVFLGNLGDAVEAD